MLFANISSDQIRCIVDGNETFIPHGDLEKTIADFLYKQEKITKAFVINGPGSFTNIRIATLAFNMYNFLNNGVADYYTIDKLSLYKKLYQHNIIPSTGYIYIGQKKNRRHIDLETMTYLMEQEFTDTGAFFDELSEGEQRESMVHLGWEGESLTIKYKNTTHKILLQDLGLESVKTIEANYMMEPNVTIKNFT